MKAIFVTQRFGFEKLRRLAKRHPRDAEATIGKTG
jgi:hypothetical protein